MRYGEGVRGKSVFADSFVHFFNLFAPGPQRCLGKTTKKAHVVISHPWKPRPLSLKKFNAHCFFRWCNARWGEQARALYPPCTLTRSLHHGLTGDEDTGARVGLATNSASCTVQPAVPRVEGISMYHPRLVVVTFFPGFCCWPTNRGPSPLLPSLPPPGRDMSFLLEHSPWERSEMQVVESSCKAGGREG